MPSLMQHWKARSSRILAFLKSSIFDDRELYRVYILLLVYTYSKVLVIPAKIVDIRSIDKKTNQFVFIFTVSSKITSI